MVKNSLFIFLLLFATVGFGQEVIGSSGQTLNNGPLTVSQTIGETITGVLTNGISVNQGFHQNDAIITSVDEENTLKLTVYPNPFVEEVLISSESEIGAITVFDLKGAVVFQKSGQTGQTNTALQLSHLSPGQYFIRVLSNEGKASQLQPIIKQ